MPNLILDEWIDLGVRGCRSITVTQRRTVETNCTDVSIEETPVELQQNLVAHWNFDAAAVAGSHFGSFNQSVLGNSGAPTIVTGKIRNAVRVPTGAALIASFVDADFNFTDDEFMLHMWLKFETFPAATEDILSKADSNTGYILRISNTGTLTWFIGNGSGYTSAVWGSALSLNTWYQVICGWNGTQVVLQVNTESVLGTAVTSALSAWTGSGQNFNLPLAPSACTFLCDTFIAWSAFLSLTDRTTLWNNGAGLPGPAFSGTQIPQAIQSLTYRLVLNAVGGTAPYTWTIISGALPAGITLNGLTGIFSGTPTDFGDFSFTIRLQDAAGNICEKNCAMHVAHSVLAGVVGAWHFNSGGPSYAADFGPFTFASIGTMSIVAGKLSNAIRIEAAETLDGTSFQSYLGLSTNLTLHCWVKFSTLPNGAQLYVDVIRKAFDVFGYILRVSDTGAVNFFTGDGSSGFTNVTWSSNILTNTWYQVICGRDASNLYIQVNTESVLGTVVSAAVGAFSPSPSPLYIPDDPPGTHTSDFMLDEFILWNGRFLSLTERTYLWNSGAGRAWPFP